MYEPYSQLHLSPYLIKYILVCTFLKATVLSSITYYP